MTFGFVPTVCRMCRTPVGAIKTSARPKNGEVREASILCKRCSPMGTSSGAMYIDTIEKQGEKVMRPMNVFVISLMTAVMRESPQDKNQLEVQDYVNIEDQRIIAENLNSAIAKMDVAGYIKKHNADPGLVFFAVLQEAKPVQIR